MAYKQHLRDIRLFNNAGMVSPVCGRGRESTGVLEDVTCTKCLTVARKRYSWAYSENRIAAIRERINNSTERKA